MGEGQWGTVLLGYWREGARKGEAVTFCGFQKLSIEQGDLGERDVEGSWVPLNMQIQMSPKAHPRLINSPKAVIVQQVGSICKGTCPGEKGYFEVVSGWVVNNQTSLNPG